MLSIVKVKKSCKIGKIWVETIDSAKVRNRQMIVSIHLSEDEEQLFKNYADFTGVDLSTLLKRVLLEKIELEHELNIIAAYEKEKAKGTLDLFDVEEVMAELEVEK